MRRTLRYTAYAGLAAVLLLAAGALYVQLSGIPRYEPHPVELRVDVTPERVARGRQVVLTLCVGCHRDRATGALSGKRMTDVPPQFGVVYSLNITQDREYGIGGWSDGEIAYLLRTGVTRDGRYTPPWMVKLPHMSDEDLADVIAFLRSSDPLVRPVHVADRAPEPTFFAKLLTRTVFKPLPYPRQPILTPPASDKVAYGRYLVTAKLDCYGCHSRDFAKIDLLEPEKSAGYFGGGNRMPDGRGGAVYTANLTPDAETGLGRWSEEQFRRTLSTGIRPDGRALRAPMTALPDLPDSEVSAIWAYLRSLPPIRNAVPAPPPAAVSVADGGRAVYAKYGCNSCHGDTGNGSFDMLKGLDRYATDEALIAYIKHPERSRPGVRMPTWDGVIEEHEYAPLARYVRSLAAAPPRRTAEPGR
jgi:mono/diheme cytochrome c family protein